MRAGGGASSDWRGCGGDLISSRCFVTVAGCDCKDCSVGEHVGWFRVVLLSIKSAFAPTMPLNAPPTESPYHLGPRESSV